jgi:DNA-binding ferritin-like protein
MIWRLFRRLQLLNIKPEQLELFLDKVAEHAFKRGLEPEVLIEKVIEISSLSEKTKVPVEELPPYIERMSKKLLRLEKKIMLKNIKADNAQQNLDVIVTRYGNVKALNEKMQLYARAFAGILI